MLNLRSTIQLSALVLFGASATLVLSSIRNTTTTILVLVALVGLLLATVITQALDKVGKVVGCVTWWQLLWLLVFVSGLVFRERDLQAVEAEPLDVWAVFRISLVCVTAFVLVLRLSLRKTTWLQHLARGLVGALGAYCLVCLASCIWSVYPGWTIYKSVELLIDVAVLAAIVATATSVNYYKILFDWTWTLEGLLLASVWLGLLLWPREALVSNVGIGGVLLAGVIPDVSPNSVGELGAVIGVIAFCRLFVTCIKRGNRFWYVCLLVIAVLTMVLAQGRSAIVGFVVGTVLALSFSGRFAIGFSLASASAILLSFGSIWETFSTFMRRGESEDQLYRLSDRVEWWSLAWPKILDHPITGYGAFAGAKFLVMAENKIDAGIHSDWVEILVGTGLLGFTLALFVLFRTWCLLIKSTRDLSLGAVERQIAIEAIAVLGIVSVRSIFTTDLFWHPPIVFFACVGYAEFLRLRQKHNYARVGSTVPAI